MPWAVLLARVFYLDALLCVKCGGKRKVLAFLTDPSVVRAILTHLGLEPSPRSLSPARLPDLFLRNLVRAADFLPIGFGVGVLCMAIDPRMRRFGDLVDRLSFYAPYRAQPGAFAPAIERLRAG